MYYFTTRIDVFSLFLCEFLLVFIILAQHYNYYFNLLFLTTSNLLPIINSPPGTDILRSRTPTHYRKLLNKDLEKIRNGQMPFAAIEGFQEVEAFLKSSRQS